MKFRGGYLPKIAGRPSSTVVSIPVPPRLSLDLHSFSLDYEPIVKTGDAVHFGDVLAEAEVSGGSLALTAPASGTVTVETDSKEEACRILLAVTDPTPSPCLEPVSPESVAADVLRSSLVRGGIWPLIWSSGCGGIPPLDGSEVPSRIVVTGVATQPFRARGKVVLREERGRIVAGLHYLQRLLADKGAVHVVLTELSDPVAVSIREEIEGLAWIRIESVPLRYPIEDPRILWRALRRQHGVSASETVWVMDIQAVASLGACLGEGLPLYERLLAVGGPGEPNPRHVRARVGTPSRDILDERTAQSENLNLRGGLFTGEPAEGEHDAVRFHDDAFFVLPRPGPREFLGFVRSGFDRVSYTPCFGTAITRRPDTHISSALRGELRPCIGCGNCEEVCPVGLLPQVIHRYLYRDAIDQAEAAGLSRCVLCGLCTFVCPSKIEHQREFADTQERLRAEHQAHADAERKHQEESKTSESGRSEDGHQ